MDRRERLEEIMQCDLSGEIGRLIIDNNIKGIKVDALTGDIDWLVNQVDILTKLENSFKTLGEDIAVVDFLRVCSEVFDDKDTPTRKPRQ